MSRPRRYTSEHINFVRLVAPGRYNDEITELFNSEFGTSLTESQMKCLKANHCIRSDVPKRRPTVDAGLFTKVQIEFIEAHVEGIKNADLANLLNETFGLSVTARQMNTWKKNHGIRSGIDTRFKKGSTPPNKGTKGRYNVGGNETSFKKGVRPRNYMPVGSERVNTDGYVDIKIADPNRWRGKHLIVWEHHNGRPVPQGYVVLFGDRDRFNFDPDNLILVSRAQLAIMNKRKLIRDDADLTRSGAILADIYHKISQRKRNG